MDVLKQREEILGVAAAESYLTGTMDESSDLDLILVFTAVSYEDILAQRRMIASGLVTE